MRSEITRQAVNLRQRYAAPLELAAVEGDAALDALGNGFAVGAAALVWRAAQVYEREVHDQIGLTARSPR
jgi:hypothetical protein